MSDKLILKNDFPKITGTFTTCPIPYKIDTYTGCTFGCKYCFARDIVQFARKTHKKENEQLNKFNYLVGLNHIFFKRWVDNTLKKDNYSTVERIAFKERLPLKIGVMADPFPYIEREQRITYSVLKTLNEIDYPVQISTKNPQILAEYIDDFITDNKTPNWSLSVTMITNDDNIRSKIEPYAPSIKNRFDGIKSITDKNINVLVRIQPIIYPYITLIYKDMIKQLYEIGVKGIIVEGLKIKMAMSKEEQLIYDEMSECLGYNLRNWYKDNGQRCGSDYVIKKEDKEEYINLLKKECHKYGMVLYVGDNDCREYNNNKECCGTSCLRNHTIFFENDNILNCKIKNIRGAKFENKTYKEIIVGDNLI